MNIICGKGIALVKIGRPSHASAILMIYRSKYRFGNFVHPNSPKKCTIWSLRCSGFAACNVRHPKQTMGRSQDHKTTGGMKSTLVGGGEERVDATDGGANWPSVSNDVRSPFNKTSQ